MIVSEAIARKINDPRLAPLTTVSRVTVSGDLSIATVFFTVVGDASVERRSLAALQHARGFVQHLVAEQVEMRQCPELRFELDEVARKVRETMALLDENRLREPHLYESQGKPSEQSDGGLNMSNEEGGDGDAEGVA